MIGTPKEKNSRTLLVDKGEVIDVVVTTKPGAKPIYISIGHMISPETEVKIVHHCSKS